MTWARPVPVIGDASSASERSQDPKAWAFSDEDRDALHRVIGARRDIRRFRPDPVPAQILNRVLSAAHAAPSVGHSQPWRFVVVKDPASREQAALLADRERHAQAAQLHPESARRLLDLQLEGLREAPVGVVVCCDRRTPAAGVLGRATFPDTDLWSCACAIENLWLAARADGLGLGWVTLFKPQELAELLGLPDGVVTLGWLCLGWPDERPPAPGLERAGWSRKAPLADVLIEERWPIRGAEPAAPPSHLRAPDQRSVVGVRDGADQLLTPPGSLGVLDRAVDRVLALAHNRSDAGTLLFVGADHPVAAHGVSAYEQSVTGEVMAAAIAGQACGVIAASTAGLTALVVDAGCGGNPILGAICARPRQPRGDLLTADALSLSDVEYLISRGRELGAGAGTRGLVALGEVGVGNTTVAAALAASLLGLDTRQVVGLGAGADAAILERKVAVVERALIRARAEHGGALHDPVRVLRALGGPEFAVLVGAVLGAAACRAAVVLDGLATSVAAALAVRLEPAIASHLIAGQRSREIAHAAVLEYLGLEPLLDLRIRAGEGVGACLASRMVHDAIRIRQLTARTRQ
jgi:nicotinate-nucleotide--dimethylbenzimidazole phosphoribosyltransferase